MIRKVGKPTKLKKFVYMCAAIFLGILLGFLVHAAVEMSYLYGSEKFSYSVTYYGNCFLPPVVQFLILLAGIVGGFLLGRWWWKKIYVERTWLKK